MVQGSVMLCLRSLGKISDLWGYLTDFIINAELDQELRLLARCKTVIILAGDSTVGKTSLVQMFGSDGSQFPKNYNMVRVIS